jgi:spermidine/putrescine transport system permease protein
MGAAGSLVSGSEPYRRARLRARSRAWPFRGLMVATLLFLYLPIAVVVLFSFNANSGLNFPIAGLSLHWYETVLTDEVYTSAIESSFIVAIGSALTTAVLGTLAVIGLQASAPRWRGPLSVLFLAPVAVPGLFIGLSLLALFGQTGIRLSLWTTAAGHVIITFPFYVLVARAALERLDPRLDDLAADLGAGPGTRFRRVTLPQVAPLLMAATLLAFAVSFDEFIITFFIIGPDSTVPLVVWSAMHRSIDPAINALATLLVVATVASAVGVWLLSTAQRNRR